MDQYAVRVLAVSLLLLFIASVAPAQIVTIPTPLYAQLTNSWCWAASGEMTMSYLGDNVAQCDQANQKFNRTDCCNQPTPTSCIHPGFPQYSAWGFTADQTPLGTALSFGQMQQQIAANKPWAFGWLWTTGGGHMMVGTGWGIIYSFPGNLRLVLINNPEPANDGGSQYWIAYDYYVSGKNHTHGNDVYNITKVNP